MTAASIPVRRPGAAALWMLVVSETKSVARDTAGLIVPLGMPLLILIMSASAASQSAGASGLTGLELFVLPLVLTMVMTMIGVVNMPSFLAMYRRMGILRRLGVTPASPALVLVAQAIVAVAQAVLGIALALAVGGLALGARPPMEPLTVLGVGALVMAAMCALGMLVAAIAPTPNSAVAIGLVLFLGLGAMGGMFGGPDALPEPMQDAAPWLPWGAAVDALANAWAGAPVEPASLLVLGATVAIGGVVAALLFRWE
ncbi:ABC transporter permease [Agrococcus sp. ARC_14]|uniref:ABC transporter permease n=1 Tax=Agrococcus sp. ARC_14 TaxID=2919927 RepID=UPI001F056362|nr:ABC transporter permease [Agrococcus sp. ARC_14]MCH1882465.1 ABC transporter permease [Agrococcus sp. ARC_14]